MRQEAAGTESSSRNTEGEQPPGAAGENKNRDQTCPAKVGGGPTAPAEGDPLMKSVRDCPNRATNVCSIYGRPEAHLPRITGNQKENRASQPQRPRATGGEEGTLASQQTKPQNLGRPMALPHCQPKRRHNPDTERCSQRTTARQPAWEKHLEHKGQGGWPTYTTGAGAGQADEARKMQKPRRELAEGEAALNYRLRRKCMEET